MGKFFQLLPVSYTEVVPGDTISGTVQSRLFSDTTFTPLLNRTYFDLFAFYVPFRLLWDEWPTFIAERAGKDLTVPTVSDAFRQNFEILGTGTAPAAWQRYCYNLVYNQFFLPS
jgi:hypothetical protein